METVTKEQFEGLGRELQASAESAQCPVWPKHSSQCLESKDITVPMRIRSLRAGGVFTIPAGFQIGQIRFPDDNIRKKVSSWVWERNAAFEGLAANEEAELPELTPNMLRELENREPLPIETRIDRALSAIGRPPSALYVTLSSSPDYELFMAATECGDATESAWLLHQLKEEGLLTTGTGESKYQLSLKGLNRLETGGNSVASKTAFVAMWFDREVSDAYKIGLAPAIREAGYKPFRIDQEEHIDRIDDRIVAEIRRSRFLVCDFTCGTLPGERVGSKRIAVARGGVYYEAGLAHGLGKKVIWTCRKDLLDHVHFDLRQYCCVVWESGKEGEFKENLLNRIRAVIA